MDMHLTHYDRIEAALSRADFSAEPSNLYLPIRYMLDMKGKRVRPMLVLLGAELFGKTDLEEVLPLSLAIEYFHNFTLIHDDIMDNAPLRRGNLPVYQKWNENIAILSGDVLMVRAYQELSKCPERHLGSLLQIFNKVAIEVCEGQQLDMDYEDEYKISEAEYLNMIRLKTSVLIGGALRMGAVVADADMHNIELIDKFGVNLGIAFQLQDDILDTYGDVASVGKRIGGDIIEYKKTILLVKLLEHMSDEEIKEMDTIMSTESCEETKIVKVKKLYEKYSILDKCISIKELYTKRALENLESIHVSDQRKEPLKKLVYDLLNRKS